MNQTITKLSKMSDSDLSPLHRVLLGLSPPGSPDRSKGENLAFINPTINDSQKSAIRNVLAASEISLIHGPPGTGKTSTIIELVLQLLILNPSTRILVCGPSNISVDNIVERLSSLQTSLPTSDRVDIPVASNYKKPTFIRLGHPARLLPSILTHSLEVLTRTSESAAITKDILNEMESKQSSIRKTRSGRERREIYADLKELRKEYRIREAKCISELVRTSNVVCCTLHGAGGRQLSQQTFDMVIIDEASQALEAQCWIPVLSVLGVKKLVLAGDHLQLPPTIKSANEKIDKKEREQNTKAIEGDLRKLSLSEEEIKTAKKSTLEKTMFDRLLDLHGEGIKTLLTTQYRMNQTIMQFPSGELYEDKVVAHDSVREHLLTDLSYEVEETDDTTKPLVLWDTQGGEFPENDEGTQDVKKASSLLSDSKSNPNECILAVKHVKSLITAGVKPEDIAVITPYNAQLSLLSKFLKEDYPAIELGSVDGFQGREKEAVVLSLVRSNAQGEVGFLGEKRRLNGMSPSLAPIRCFLVQDTAFWRCANPSVLCLVSRQALSSTLLSNHLHLTSRYKLSRP